MMDLSSTCATMHAAPIIPLEYNISLSLPFIRLKVIVSIIITTAFPFYLEHPVAK
jgi:hypothetical protein